jgi:hypothetical protein
MAPHVAASLLKFIKQHLHCNSAAMCCACHLHCITDASFTAAELHYSSMPLLLLLLLFNIC